MKHFTHHADEDGAFMMDSDGGDVVSYETFRQEQCEVTHHIQFTRMQRIDKGAFRSWRDLVRHRIMWNADVPEFLPGMFRTF